MLTPGQVLYDNDPRYRGRTVEVVRIEGSYGHLQMRSASASQIRLSYIFQRRRAPRRSGYSTVAPKDIVIPSCDLTPR